MIYLYDNNKVNIKKKKVSITEPTWLKNKYHRISMTLKSKYHIINMTKE
jgi:hypothetical protein